MMLLAAMAMSKRITAQEAYAVYTSANNGTLTFYYDQAKNYRAGAVYSLNTSGKPGWYEDERQFEKVVFDATFADARPTSTYYWFGDQENLKTIVGIKFLNTSEVTNMQSMFWRCGSLTSVDVSGFDTHKVTTMECMFSYCESLTSLDVSHWDTSNVLQMRWMFARCKSLTSLDVSNWDTSKVRRMNVMFLGCNSLASLDVSHWNTGNVTDMGDMFYECHSLTSIDVSHWDTHNVTYMIRMFYGCKKLTNLDLSGFDTSNVNNMEGMFTLCENLTSLDVNGWNTDKVTSMIDTFEDCSSLTTLDLSSWNTGNVENMRYMFAGCSLLSSICVGTGWSTEKVTESISMFNACERLVGEKGTSYNANHTNASYAHIDGGSSNPGYLSVRKYNLWVCDARVTWLNHESLPVTHGTASYNPKTKTLTLNNASISVEGQSSYAISNGDPWENHVVGIDDLTIEVIGTCRLYSQSIALLVNGNTTITGTGHLIVDGKEEGIWIGPYNLTCQARRISVTGLKDAVLGSGFACLVMDGSFLDCSTTTPATFYPLKDLFRLILTNGHFADPGGAWKYADPTHFYYDENRQHTIFGSEDYHGSVLIEPNSEPFKYRLWVGETRVTSTNKNNIGGLESGTASFDPTTHTLTLNDAEIRIEGYDNGISNGLDDMEGIPDFKIVCNGTNCIETIDGYGLALYGNTTITGSRLNILTWDKGIYLEDFKELTLQDADIYTEAPYPIYCGYNTFVYVRHSRLEADPGRSQNSPVVGAREFDLVDCYYVDPDYGIDPDRLYYNEQKWVMYYDGSPYDGPLLIIPTGSDFLPTSIDAARLNDKGQMINDKVRDGWYTLDGRKLDNVPTAKGVYIKDGRKIVIK